MNPFTALVDFYFASRTKTGVQKRRHERSNIRSKSDAVS